MATKDDLDRWFLEVQKVHPGRVSWLEICRYVWEHHGDELRRSGDLFFTWQYDIRWSPERLRTRKARRDPSTAAREKRAKPRK